MRLHFEFNSAASFPPRSGFVQPGVQPDAAGTRLQLGERRAARRFADSLDTPMPIVAIEVVCQSEAQFGEISARPLADALGKAFGSEPENTWVKLRYLGSESYAENESEVPDSELPVFVSVLHARPPQDEALAVEAKAVTLAVAQCLGRAPERVHVLYEPSAVGRQAFGGILVR